MAVLKSAIAAKAIANSSFFQHGTKIPITDLESQSTSRLLAGSFLVFF
jgi:hypothetical protein